MYSSFVEIGKRELNRHKHMLAQIRKVIYSNKDHIRGIEPYEDKKRLLQLWNRVTEQEQLLNMSDFQFLESMFEKYSV